MFFSPLLKFRDAKLQHIFCIIVRAQYVFKHIFETLFHNPLKTCTLYVSIFVS